MKFGVFTDPGVAIININGMYVFVGHWCQDIKPLLQELGAKSIVGVDMREINNHFEGGVTEGFKC